MALEQKKIDLAELSIDFKLGLKDYSPLYKTGTRLKNLLLNQNIQTDIKSGRTPSRFNKKYWNGENEFLTMSDVDTLTFSINPECVDKITDFAVDEENTLYKARENALIISNAMTVGLSFILDRPVYINQNVFEVKLNENKVNKKFILWYLNLIVKPLFQTIYHEKYLSKDELARIKIPLISKKQQDQIVAEIKPIEKHIKELSSQIKNLDEIINQVFARQFEFDLEKFEELQKKVFFKVEFAELKARDNLSLWVPFVLPQLKYKYAKINKFLAVCESGKRPKGGIREENEGEAISLGGEQIGKDGSLELSKIPYVSYDFYKNSTKGKVQNEDILICKDGALTGKTCFVDFSLFPSEKVMVNEHVYIIRSNENISQKFLFYFTITDLFQSQVKDLAYRKKGQPGLNKDHFEKIKIPLISKSIQNQIVDEIQVELEKRDNINKQIQAERSKIDKIIQQLVT